MLAGAVIDVLFHLALKTTSWMVAALPKYSFTMRKIKNEIVGPAEPKSTV